jgi:hypothetical protein
MPLFSIPADLRPGVPEGVPCIQPSQFCVLAISGSLGAKFDMWLLHCLQPLNQLRSVRSPSRLSLSLPFSDYVHSCVKSNCLFTFDDSRTTDKTSMRKTTMTTISP